MARKKRPAAAGSEVKEQLETLALAGRGWPAILSRLSDASGRRIRLVGVHGGLLAASDSSARLASSTSVPASGVRAPEGLDGGLDGNMLAVAFAADGHTSVACADGFRACASAVYAGPRRIGLLLMEEPVTTELAELLDDARLAVAIEAVRRDEGAKARAESAGRLINELRFGPLRDPDGVMRAAERFGLELRHPHAAAVFAYDGSNQRTWSTAISWIEMPVQRGRGLGWTVLTGDIESEVRRIRRRLQGILGDEAPVLAATGPLVSGIEETQRSFREAEIVLAVLRRRAGEVELTHRSLGLAGLLLSVSRPGLEEFIEHHLGPILHDDDLLATLATWYATNGSRAAVAEHLGVHRNSVGYRMGRIRQLLSRDPLDPATGFELQAALRCREVLRAINDMDPAAISAASAASGRSRP
jgi:PucR C-terminal helix-turn-helix domain/GGDEF-like domain